MDDNDDHRDDNTNPRLLHLQRLRGDRVLYNHPCLMASENHDDDDDDGDDDGCLFLPATPPEALESVGVTADRHWPVLTAAYKPLATRYGPRWRRVRRILHGCMIGVFVAFCLLVVVVAAFFDDDDAPLLRNLATLGWLPLYGVLTALNVVLNVLRKRMWEGPLQQLVVTRVNHAWSDTSSRDDRRRRRHQATAVPVRLQLYLISSCRRDGQYYLSFLYHAGADNVDEETVASEDAWEEP